MCRRASLPVTLVMCGCLLAPGVLADDPLAEPAARETSWKEGLVHCAEMADPAARLGCFDALAARYSGRAVGPAGSVQAAASVQAVAEARFGAETLPAPAADIKPESVRSTIAVLAETPLGKRVFTLTNGQVWAELEKGRGHYHDGDAVTIERSTFGAYMLSTGKGRASRVRRLE